MPLQRGTSSELFEVLFKVATVTWRGVVTMRCHGNALYKVHPLTVVLHLRLLLSLSLLSLSLLSLRALALFWILWILRVYILAVPKMISYRCSVTK